MTEVVGERVKGHCPECGPGRRAIIKGTHQKRESLGSEWVRTTHRILECCGCDEVFHQTDQVYSEDYLPIGYDDEGRAEYDYDHKIEHWPAPSKRERPKWIGNVHKIDTELHGLLAEVYAALDAGLDVLSAIGIRTAFDRGAELLGVDPAKTFAEKLKDLTKTGAISETERDSLQVMTEAGNASAHRGWRPSTKQLDTMMQIIESFVHRSFILRADVSDLKNAVPPRPRRRAP